MRHWNGICLVGWESPELLAKAFTTLKATGQAKNLSHKIRQAEKYCHDFGGHVHTLTIREFENGF